MVGILVAVSRADRTTFRAEPVPLTHAVFLSLYLKQCTETVGCRGTRKRNMIYVKDRELSDKTRPAKNDLRLIFVLSRYVLETVKLTLPVLEISIERFGEHVALIL